MSPLPTPSLSRLVTVDGAELPLRAAHLRAAAHAGFARVTLEQVFANPHPHPVEVSYQLPLPADGAVGGFSFVLGDERVVGRVRRTADARETYTRALQEGRTAALLEAVRDGLFSQRVGNVPAGATVRVTVEIDQPLAWQDGGWEWRFPTVVAPRYVDALVSDADRLAVEVSSTPLPERLTLALSVADTLTGPVSSPSHALGGAGPEIALAAGRARLDRDVVARWPVAAPTPGAAVSTGTFGGERFALITLVPPLTPRAVVPRDLILLLDVSGSMSGEPMHQLQRVSDALVAGLEPSDTLEVVAFGGTVKRWRTAPEAMHPLAKADAQRWIAALRASGGTPMDEGIREALAGKRVEAQRQVVLMTDGEIGFEGRVVDLIRAHLGPASRLHVVGVGHGVNRALTAPAARVGAGLEEILTPGELPSAAIARLTARMERPVVVDVTVEGAALAVVPERAPDLFAGAPARLLVRVRPGVVRVVGRCGDGAWSHALTIAEDGPERADLARLFAREAVADLEVRRTCQDADVEARIEELGLRYGVVTRMTSFLAVSEAVTVAAGTPTVTVSVPHELTAGMSLEGLGLLGVGAPRLDAFAGAPPMPSAAPGEVPRMRAAPSPMRAPPPPPSMAEASRRQEARAESMDAMREPPRPKKLASAPAQVVGALGGALRRLLGHGRPVTATAARWEGEVLVVRLSGVAWTSVAPVRVDGVEVEVTVSSLADGSTELRLRLPGRPALASLSLPEVRLADGSVVAVEVALPAVAGA